MQPKQINKRNYKTVKKQKQKQKHILKHKWLWRRDKVFLSCSLEPAGCLILSLLCSFPFMPGSTRLLKDLTHWKRICGGLVHQGAASWQKRSLASEPHLYYLQDGGWREMTGFPLMPLEGQSYLPVENKNLLHIYIRLSCMKLLILSWFCCPEDGNFSKVISLQLIKINKKTKDGNFIQFSWLIGSWLSH